MAALQAIRQNYRWIPTASSHMGDVEGDVLDLTVFTDLDSEKLPKVTYKEGLFDSEEMVLFDITGKPSNENCYFCHSDQNLSIADDYEWTRDEDVHLQSGMNCVDCHRNGDDHMITRGIETDGPAKSLTCEGCHLESHSNTPESGRLGAPEPKHRGIPTIHFETMTCTACHSGTWPEKQVQRWQTARIHKTGLHGIHTPYVPQPYVYAPVLMKGVDGKISPHKLFWPAYWATIEGQEILPLSPKAVLETAGEFLNEKTVKVDDWEPLTETQITAVLKKLSTEKAKSVYIAGGKLYKLADNGLLVSDKHDSAAPYAWPIAHDVRPSEQSLGIRKCKDCHTTESTFFFGSVEIDSPVKTESGAESIEIIKLQGINRMYMWAFNFSFIFRPFLKMVAFASCGLIALVLLAYGLRAVAAIANTCIKESD
jgi:hypothetical protein